MNKKVEPYISFYQYGNIVAGLKYFHVFGGYPDEWHGKRGKKSWDFRFLACYLTPKQNEDLGGNDPELFCIENGIAFGKGNTPQDAIDDLMKKMS